MLSPRWRKVFRDLWDNKSRTILVVMSIAVGVVAFGGMFTAREIMLLNLSSAYTQANPHDIAIDLPPFEDDLVRWALRQDGVTGAQPMTVQSAELLVGDIVFDLTLNAYEDFDRITIDRITPQTGILPPGRGDIFFERSYVFQLGIAPGDDVIVRLPDDTTYTLRYAGTIHSVTVPSGMTVASNIISYVAPRTLADMDLSADYNRLLLTVDRPAFDFFGTSLNQIADDIRNDLIDGGVEVRSVEVEQTLEHWATDTLNGLITVLVVIGFVSLLLSGFLIINTISGLIAQQKRQIGVMKIVGASRGQIITVYMVMVAIFGALALMIALPVSYMMANALAQMLGPNFINFDIDNLNIPLYVYLVQIAVAFLSPMLSALFPILNGTGITAAAALSDHRAGSRTSLVAVLLARIKGLPRPALLSLRNIFRNQSRLVMTLITLVLAGAFFMAALNVREAMGRDAANLLQMAKYDVMIRFTEFYNEQGILRRALNTPGVVAAEGWLSTDVTRVRPDGIVSGDFTLSGLPADSRFVAPRLMAGRWLEPLENANDYELVITDEMLVDEPDLRLGDLITLKLDGREDDWRIVGILDTDSVGGGEVTVYSQTESVAHFMQIKDQINQVTIDTSQDTVEFQQAIIDTLQKHFEDIDLLVNNTTSNAEALASVQDNLVVITLLLMVTAALIAIVGGLGLMGTMSLSVLERTREIGVMRSIGSTTNTLRFMFILEGLLIGLMSAVIAMLLSVPVTLGFGAVLGGVIIGRPWSFVINPMGIVLWLVIIIIISAFASVLPAQRASQISIREALAYE
jgi:putative ABC transport system permease protein